MNIKLSDLAEKIDGQPMFKLLSLAKELEANGANIIHFEIGDPSFGSPKLAIEKAQDALQEGKTHYTDSYGTLALRKKLISYTKLHWGFEPQLDQVLVCPANALIDFTFRCIANPGEEIILPDPSFPTYNSVLKYTGINPAYVPLKPENGFRMQPDDIEKLITKKTKAILINSPHNPTGSVLRKKEIIQISELARENGLFLISDEVYSRIIFKSGHYSPSYLDRCKERTIIINSMSKVFAMSGWRIGYSIGPSEVIKKMGLLTQTILSCLPEFTQAGAEVALDTEKVFIDSMNVEYAERMNLLVNGLNNIPGISCVKPEGAFYIFPQIDQKFGDTKDYCHKLLEEEGVCVLPGEYFGEKGKNSIRLSYSATTKDDIKLALDKINRFHLKYF